MAKSTKSTSKPVSKTAASNGKKAAAPKVVARSEVRNSPLPKAAARPAAAARQITGQMIATRAYEIWASGQGGSDFDNWVRAERELRGGL